MSTEESLREKKYHGDEHLPFTIYFSTFIKGINDLYPHWHDEIEIVYVTGGKGRFRVDLSTFNVISGDILFIKPEAMHSAFATKDNNLMCDSILLNLNMLRAIIPDAVTKKYIEAFYSDDTASAIKLNIKSNDYTEISNTYKELIMTYTQKKLGFELELKCKLFHMFYLVFKNGYIEKTNTPNRLISAKLDVIKNVLDYINTNLTTNISLKELAEVAQYSEYHFTRFFKEQTGFTTTKYINQLRVQRSRALLKETTMSITDIASEIGFDNVSYFIKIFREHYSMTPNKYRNSR